MSVAKAISIRSGNVNSRRMYIQIANGNIYYWPNDLTQEKFKRMEQSITSNNSKVKLKGWVKVTPTARTIINSI